jgi:hypothetical protein
MPGCRAPAAPFAEGVRQAADAIQRRSGAEPLGQQGMRLRGRHQPLPFPREQLEAEAVFRLPQHLAGSRLRDAQLLRRLGNAAAFHDGAEHFEVP